MCNEFRHQLHVENPQVRGVFIVVFPGGTSRENELKSSSNLYIK